MRAPIVDRKKRSTTFARRMHCLKKKALELQTLCDTPTLLLCFDEDGGLHSWPEDPQHVFSFLARYKGFPVSQRRRLDSSDAFIGKEETPVPLICVPPSSGEGEDVVAMLDAKIKAVNQRTAVLRRQQQEVPPPPCVLDALCWTEEEDDEVMMLSDEMLETLFEFDNQTEEGQGMGVLADNQIQLPPSLPSSSSCSDLDGIWSTLPTLQLADGFNFTSDQNIHVELLHADDDVYFNSLAFF